MKQPWIYSARVDGAFILAPALVISAIVLLLHEKVTAFETMPVWMWGVLIVGVDVAHVYSTLFRTYADKQEFAARRTLYVLTPFVCWVVGTLLYSVDAIVFWRAIAYLAVFHFVRQQYGFMMIYGRKDYDHHKAFRLLDKTAIYMATLYPLIYWHTSLPRKFEWFVEGDFFVLSLPWLQQLSLAFYAVILLAYITKECWLVIKGNSVNIPKNILLIGTAVSWWVGIVAFNNDIAFTAANVLAHGIPYMALIWIYGRNQASLEPQRQMVGGVSFKRFFSPVLLPVFVGVLVGLGYFEEGLWDGLVWKDHKSLFLPFQVLPPVDEKATLSWLVPLLALPQLTHYALDGFIWRLKTPDTNWKQVLFYREQNI